MVVVLSAGFTWNLLYKCNGNTQTSAPVSSVMVSLPQSPLIRTSVCHAEKFLIPSIWSGLRENPSDDRYESPSLFELGSLWVLRSVSCTSWTVHLDLVVTITFVWVSLWSCAVLLPGKDFLLWHTLAKWCNLWQIEHFSPYAGHSFGLWVYLLCPQYVGIEPQHPFMASTYIQSAWRLHVFNLLFGWFWLLCYLYCLA